jgi:hypothetical protein
MAIMEHAYYASFGYQITSFFAASRYVYIRYYLAYSYFDPLWGIQAYKSLVSLV